MFQQISGRPGHPETIAANFIFKQESKARADRELRTEN